MSLTVKGDVSVGQWNATGLTDSSVSVADGFVQRSPTLKVLRLDGGIVVQQQTDHI